MINRNAAQKNVHGALAQSFDRDGRQCMAVTSSNVMTVSDGIQLSLAVERIFLGV